jgi:hypothetical protein
VGEGFEVGRIYMECKKALLSLLSWSIVSNYYERERFTLVYEVYS